MKDGNKVNTILTTLALEKDEKGQVGGVLLSEEKDPLKVNQRITAQWLKGKNKRKYPAKMRHRNRDGTYVIWYDDGNVRFDVTREEISTDLTPQQSEIVKAEQREKERLKMMEEKERREQQKKIEAEEAERKKKEIEKRIRKKVGRKSHWGVTVVEPELAEDENVEKLANRNVKLAIKRKKRERLDIDVKKPRHLLMTTAGPLPPKMLGWLEKKENRLWKNRYCWLEDDNFMVYSKGPEQKILGRVNFSSRKANIRATADESEFFIEVGDVVHYFRGNSVHVRDHWLHSLKALQKQDLIKIMHDLSTDIRKTPEIDGERFGQGCYRGSIIAYKSKKTGKHLGHPVVYYELSDGRGWINTWMKDSPSVRGLVELPARKTLHDIHPTLLTKSIPIIDEEVDLDSVEHTTHTFEFLEHSVEPWGIKITLGDHWSKWIVSSVYNGKQAERVGVRVGDRVMGIDKINIHDENADLMKKTLLQGDPCHITFRRKRKAMSGSHTIHSFAFKPHYKETWGVEIAFDLHWSKWKVLSVHRGLQAERLGVRVGDRLITVDGIKINDSNHEEIEQKLIEGVPCLMGLSRKNRMRVELPRDVGVGHQIYTIKAGLTYGDLLKKVVKKINLTRNSRKHLKASDYGFYCRKFGSNLDLTKLCHPEFHTVINDFHSVEMYKLKAQRKQPQESKEVLLMGQLQRMGIREIESHEIKNCVALLKRQQENHEHWYNLAALLSAAGRVKTAVKCYKMSLKYAPCFKFSNNNLGAYYHEVGKYDEAVDHFQKAIESDASFYVPVNNLAITYVELGKLGEAQKYCKQALELQPLKVEIINLLGHIYLQVGNARKAVECFKKCVTLDPTETAGPFNSSSSRCLASTYAEAPCEDELVGTEEDEYNQKIWTCHRKWAIPYERKAVAGVCKTYLNDRDPDRCIKVGYISTHFREHPVSYLIENALKHTDEKRIKTYVYMSGPPGDKRTAEIMEKIPDSCRCFLGKRTREQICEIILEDEIDILVDLGGHTTHNRLDVMTLKPAPIQISWIGYPNTTGLSCIDYQITDTIADPFLTNQKYSERLYRMPSPCSFLSYSGSKDGPECTGTPALKKGYVTFGCFCPLNKWTKQTLALWCQILNAVPKSHIYVSCSAFSCDIVKARYIKKFENAGIKKERIIITKEAANRKEHFSMFSNIDICLDVFPYSGVIETLEALWMGCPVITLQRVKFPIRSQNIGASFLTRVPGLKKFIAKNKKEYLDIALHFSEHLKTLNEVKINLRQKMLKSPLCDGPLFGKKLTEVYVDMWHKFLDGESKSSY